MTAFQLVTRAKNKTVKGDGKCGGDQGIQKAV